MSAAIDIPVAGGELAVYRLGSQRPDAPAVLAVHGITATSFAWLSCAAALGDEVSLIAVDLRGRGESGSPARAVRARRPRRGPGRRARRAGAATARRGRPLDGRLHRRAARRPPSRSRLAPGAGRRGADDPGESPRSTPSRSCARSWARRWRDWRYVREPRRVRRVVAEASRDHGLGHRPAVLRRYAEHDLVGDPPALRSSVNPDVLRPDGVDVLRSDDAHRLALPAVLLCAPRGMVNDPNPMQPLELVRAWAAEDPERRRGAAGARRQPLHDHARRSRRGGGRRRGPRGRRRQLTRRKAWHRRSAARTGRPLLRVVCTVPASDLRPLRQGSEHRLTRTTRRIRCELPTIDRSNSPTRHRQRVVGQGWRFDPHIRGQIATLDRVRGR